jgi:ribosome maturation factor RimP
MRPTDPTTEKLLRLAEPVCKGAGYELVDLALAPSREGLVLRVFIDYLPLPLLAASATGDAGEAGAERPEAERSEISLADCERLSRELGTALDVEDVIGHAYHLEVSSPGVDRPLRTLEHFRRFAGQEIKVKLHDGVEGRRNFKGMLLGVTQPAGSGAGATPGVAPDATIEALGETQGEANATITMDVDGKEYALPFGDIESARIVPDWDAIMGKGTGRSPGKSPGKPGHS